MPMVVVVVEPEIQQEAPAEVARPFLALAVMLRRVPLVLVAARNGGIITAAVMVVKKEIRQP
jgi:hypothetical protein